MIRPTERKEARKMVTKLSAAMMDKEWRDEQERKRLAADDPDKRMRHWRRRQARRVVRLEQGKHACRHDALAIAALKQVRVSGDREWSLSLAIRSANQEVQADYDLSDIECDIWLKKRLAQRPQAVETAELEEESRPPEEGTAIVL